MIFVNGANRILVCEENPQSPLSVEGIHGEGCTKPNDRKSALQNISFTSLFCSQENSKRFG
jgi:hypothetical protein